MEDNNFSKLILFHKNTPVASVLVRHEDYLIVDKIYYALLLPVPFSSNNETLSLNLSSWFVTRSSWWQKEFKRIGHQWEYQLGYFKLQSHALSLSDHYWLGLESDNYDNLNFYTNSFSSEIGDYLFYPQNNYEKWSGREIKNPFSPDLTTEGVVPKHWIIENSIRKLEKSNRYTSEAINEVLAYEICKRLNINCVEYSYQFYEKTIEYDKDDFYTEPYSTSKCPTFINLENELIHASELYSQHNCKNSKEFYDVICKIIPNGQQTIANMVLLDSLICNYDRHYHNFGFLRNSNTLEWLKQAPLYDNGFSFINENYYNTKIRFGNTFKDAMNNVNCKKHCKNIDLNCLNDMESTIKHYMSLSSLYDSKYIQYKCNFFNFQLLKMKQYFSN